jgi:methyl-accepting chemotaxis protein
MRASVKGKLVVGFGAVLMLTALLTCIALYSVKQLTTRSEALVDTISLDSQIAAIRLQEAEFDRTGDEQIVDAYTREIKKLDAIVNNVQRSAGSEGQGIIERIKEVRGAYQKTFTAFVAAKLQAKRAQIEMDPVVGDIATKLNLVALSLFETIRKDSSVGINALQSTVELQAMLNTLRDEVRAYTDKPDDPALQRVSEKADLIRQRGNDVWEMLPTDSLQQLLVEGLQTVVVYQDRVAEFRDNMLKSQAAKQLMLDQANELQTLSAAIYQQQVDGRRRDVSLAQGELSFAAFFALLFGLLASWMITRQIVPPLNQALRFAQQIASGELTGTLESGAPDEIGQMVAAMHEMAIQLRQIIGSIGGGAYRLTSAAQELSVVTAQNSIGATSRRL